MEQATLQINGSPAKALLTPLDLPSWNEAFLSIDGPKTPVVGQRYRLRVRPGLNGWLEYTAISPTRIDITWQVPGFHEDGVWLIDQGLVTHSFEHKGALAAVLRSAYRGIAAVRLERLAAVS
ncbi:hypothetical protein [Kribbella catacumbae]|uniref:hypothetical protein n=1 Tax=Kribbella catacumbae TaxID=460086 RepID=UPI00037B9600|nr:hypothetical protein [Kribbella catacumbae]